MEILFRLRGWTRSRIVPASPGLDTILMPECIRILSPVFCNGDWTLVGLNNPTSECQKERGVSFIGNDGYVVSKFFPSPYWRWMPAERTAKVMEITDFLGALGMEHTIVAKDGYKEVHLPLAKGDVKSFLGLLVEGLEISEPTSRRDRLFPRLYEGKLVPELIWYF